MSLVALALVSALRLCSDHSIMNVCSLIERGTVIYVILLVTVGRARQL